MIRDDEETEAIVAELCARSAWKDTKRKARERGCPLKMIEKRYGEDLIPTIDICDVGVILDKVIARKPLSD